MRRCTDCEHCDSRGGQNYCKVKDYFVSIQAIFCKSFELSMKIKRQEALDYIITETALDPNMFTVETIDLMIGFSEYKLNKKN